MNRPTLAGLVVAGAIAVIASNAAPSAAQQPGPPPQPGVSQPQPGNEPPPGGMGPGGPDVMGGRGGRSMGSDRGEMMGMGPERREMMHRMMMRRTPQERCLHHVARRAGMVAYAATMLNLSPEQRPLWDRLNNVIQQNLQNAQQLCASLDEMQGRNTLLDRLDRAERFSSARLQAIQQIRPPLQQFYQALNPEQRTVLDRIFSHRRERS